MSQFDHEDETHSPILNALIRDIAAAPSNIELIRLTAAALHERAAYILEHADTIYVRVEMEGRWDTRALGELPAAVAIAEAFRMLLHATVRSAQP